MKLTVEKLEEQFNLYFKGEKKLEAIKEWANKYDVYKEELVFSPNENKKELLKWIKILKNIKVIQFAESLGGVESLMTYPMYQTHADVPMEERLARGIDECLLRLSVGIEDVNDLIEDLSAGFKRLDQN